MICFKNIENKLKMILSVHHLQNFIETLQALKNSNTTSFTVLVSAVAWGSHGQVSLRLEAKT
jgi:hypothetical protein